MKCKVIMMFIFTMNTLAFATTWTVDDDGAADFATIQEAIDAASDGDEIIVMPGTYTGSGDWVIDLSGKAVWLHSSEGSATTLIDGENARTCIYCNSDETSLTIIEGFKITNGNGNAGGGMYCYQADPTIRGCTFYSNHAFNGGGINCGDSSPSIENCLFVGNDAPNAGGGLNCVYSSPSLLNCAFTNNTAVRGAGIYCALGSPALTDCSFAFNSASLRGGGMVNNQLSTPTLTNCTFLENTAPTGGGIYNYDSSPNLTSCIFTDNTATNGGAVGNSYSSIVLTDCNFTGNVAIGVGGGVFNDNTTATVTTCLFQENASERGGGMCNYSSNVVIADSTFENNSATIVNSYTGGGGMYNGGSTLSMTTCTFNNNQAQAGGAMDCHGSSASIINSNFTNNVAQVNGGGFYCSSSDVVIADSVLENNVAEVGDGFYVWIGSLNFVGTNSIDEIYLYHWAYSNSRLDFLTDTYCYVTNDVTTPYGGSTTFDINNLVTDETLTVGWEFIRAGALGITNDSNSLFAANVGNIVPLVQASTLSGSFSSVTLPAMPDGLGLQLIEQEAPRGADTEIAVQVIEVEGANFANPFEGDLDSPPVDMVSFDADGDGVDEIALLFGGNPGGVAVYAVSEDGPPTLIDGFSAEVGSDPVDLDAGDLNGDGLDDLLVVDGESATLTILVTEVSGGSLTFVESTFKGSDTFTCVAMTDWGGDSVLDAVVGVTGSANGYQIYFDVSLFASIGPWFPIPDYQLPDSTHVPDPPTCVDGGNQSGDWGFVGGTHYGRVHRGSSASALQLITEIAAEVGTIDAMELDSGDGDGLIDLMVSSEESQMLYLFQGIQSEGHGFEDMIPIAVSEPVVDVVAIDVDYDGDKDIVMAAPDSAHSPLTLLRNDGGSSGLVVELKGNTWSKQNMNSGNPLTNIEPIDVNDDKGLDSIVGSGGAPTLRGELAGTLEQTNILLGSDCVADIDGDGEVNVADLLILIGAWGPCPDCDADLDNDGEANVADLLILIGAWGQCK